MVKRPLNAKPAQPRKVVARVEVTAEQIEANRQRLLALRREYRSQGYEGWFTFLDEDTPETRDYLRRSTENAVRLGEVR